MKPLEDAFEVLDAASALASDMIELVHDELLVAYRFMNRPLAQLPVRVRMDVQTCSTDARELAFSPGFVLKSYNGARPLLARAYLHMTLHCLLRHPFVPEGADPLRWTCAADAAVCALMQQLASPAIDVPDEERDLELARLVERVGREQPTAAEIYRLFEREGLGQAELTRLDLLFGMDSHDRWTRDELPSAETAQPTDETQAELRKQWEKIARQTEIDLQREQAGRDERAQTVSLAGLAAEPMGLDELLRQFAVPSEALKVNPDEFDYIYYTYGLQTYGNIPLVEPLEYCDSPHVRDFAVAIDTSGSIERELAEKFVARACGMLLAENALGQASRVRVFQCDTRITDEQVLRKPADVEAYLRAFELRGRGGTDLRPVFERIDELVESGEVADMSGLVYFTDGLGETPRHAPSYDTAFVFVDKPGPAPPWATSVLTYSDEL